MPRRSILSAAERDNLLAWPDTHEELIRRYTLSETDLSIIRQHRGTANRLGYAVQLCTMRYPGIIAWHTDKGVVLATALIGDLRKQQVLLPTLNSVERICAEAVTRANRRIYAALTESLTDAHRQRLDDLLRRKEGSKMTVLAWLRQSPAKPNSRHMLEHIERIRTFEALGLAVGIERQIHQNRLLKIAREGGQVTPADLSKFEPQRRYATLVGVAVEGSATVIDEAIDLHDRFMGKMFNAAKHKHQSCFRLPAKRSTTRCVCMGG